MLKKSIALAIALVVVGLTLIPLVQAQDFAAMQRELMQVQQDLQTGRITEAQATVRMNEINQKYLGGAGTIGGMPQGSTSGSDAGQAQNWAIRDQATQQAQQAVQQPQHDTFETGSTSGWPSNSIFSQCSLSNLRQPAGTTVSYNYDSADRRLTVFIRGGTQAHFDELATAISGGNNYRGQTHIGISRPIPSGLRGYDGYRAELELQSGGIVLRTAGSAQ